MIYLYVQFLRCVAANVSNSVNVIRNTVVHVNITSPLHAVITLPKDYMFHLATPTLIH